MTTLETILVLLVPLAVLLALAYQCGRNDGYSAGFDDGYQTGSRR